MTSIMGPIGPEQLELFALEFGKIAEFEFVYYLKSANINHSAPNLVNKYNDYQISDEFDFVSNWARNTGVICS